MKEKGGSATIADFGSPLSDMAPRIFTVERCEHNWTILDWLRARLRLGAEAARRLLQGRQVRIAGNPCSNPGWRLRAGQRVEVRMRGQRTAEAARSGGRRPRALIRYLDDQLIVVDKPAGLTTMRHADEAAEFGSRARKFLPATLADLLPSLVASYTGGPPGPVRAVHRLDRDTSGLVVFARTAAAERHLGRQFREHSIERVYQAVVRGQAQSGRIESWLVSDRGDGRRGSGPPGAGQRAVTHVLVIEPLGQFTLVECRLETGRTHQVRIHLGEAGTPLCGERIYDRPVHGRPVPDGSGIGRIALHAAVLGLEHPQTGERCHWTAPLPADLVDLLTRLRRQRSEAEGT